MDLTKIGAISGPVEMYDNWRKAKGGEASAPWNQAMVGGLLGGTAATGAALAVPTKDPITPELFEKMKAALGARSDMQFMDVEKHPMGKASPANPYGKYNAFVEGIGDEAPPRVWARKGAPSAVVAHELGHASGKLPGWYKGLQAFSRGAGTPLGLAAGLGGALALDPESTAAKAAPYAPVALAAPMLAEETRATWRGLRALKAAGRSRLGGLARLIVPLLGYGAVPAAVGMGAEGVRRGRAAEELF